MNKNVVGWFEIPVSDLDRAIKFYEKVLDLKLTRSDMGKFQMAWFPSVEDGMGAPGSLIYSEGNYHPSQDGILIYFTSPSGDVQNEMERINAAGGEVLRPKTQISEDVGYMGLFIDSEGNRIAIHSRQ
jgi:predicted enzyme related to lactoylglutathione lyase